MPPPVRPTPFRCRACMKDFTLTSGTLFASHKLPLRMYLAAIAIAMNEVKGKSALASRATWASPTRPHGFFDAQNPRGHGGRVQGPVRSAGTALRPR